MIADSSFIVDLLRGRPDAFLFLRTMQNPRAVAVSSITIFELFQYRGFQNIDGFMTQVLVIDVTLEIAKVAGLIQKELVNRGLEIDNEDCIIAATALLEKMPLITKNVKHFSRIKGLQIFTY